jgi:hypothetical protein
MFTIPDHYHIYISDLPNFRETCYVILKFSVICAVALCSLILLCQRNLLPDLQGIRINHKRKKFHHIRKGEDNHSCLCEPVGEGGCRSVVVWAISAGRVWLEIEEKIRKRFLNAHKRRIVRMHQD